MHGMKTLRTAGVLATLVLSAGVLTTFGAVRDDRKPEKQKADEELLEKQRTLSMNNLRLIGQGFHNYGSDNKDKWADDLTDKDGLPLLSWRVAVLPYMGEKTLYKEFHLNEPWDSEHNKKLIAKIPEVYAPVRVKAKEGETFYQRFVGKGALFNEKGSSYTIPTVPDGLSNTALVVEAGDPVIWTKPADLAFNAKGPLPKLGGLFDGEFSMLFCDGHVQRLRKDFDADEMRKVIIPDDGKSIDFDKLAK
jgi:prepilin-type processing-associated H-X9-DG protein